MISRALIGIAVIGAALSSQTEEGQVRVLRDPWGVPHVLSETDYGVGYGYGWALAEDRLEEALNGYWTVLGRRTEVDGEEAMDIDRTFKLLRLTQDAERAFDKLPKLVRDVAEGYAAGFNDAC